MSKIIINAFHRILIRRFNCSETDHRPVSDTVYITKSASTASRHSWVGQETSWKYLNNLNWFGIFTSPITCWLASRAFPSGPRSYRQHVIGLHFHMDGLDKMRRSCKVRLTVSCIRTKCQAFQNTTEASIPCVNNHWIRTPGPRWLVAGEA